MRYNINLSLILLILIVLGCKQNRKPIIIDGYMAVGKLLNDSIFEGEINFYDTSTGLLKRTSNYKFGKLSGESKTINSIGKVSSVSTYDNNRLNGPVILYDSIGNMTKFDFYYFDLRVGPSIDYVNNKPTVYNFISLDGRVLFTINYEAFDIVSILKNGSFFYQINEFQEFLENGINMRKSELFLYTPNPPLINFRYSIIELDSNGIETNELYIFDKKYPWSVYKFPQIMEDKMKRYAIKLLVSEYNSKKEIILLKKL